MSVLTGFQLDSCGYRQISRSITNEEKRNLSTVFYEVDTGNKGFLSREDTKVAIVQLFGYKPSKYEIDQIMENHAEQCGNTKGIPLAKYMTAMAEKISKQDEDEEIRHAFMAFDSQCRGFLTYQDLQKAVSQVAPHLPDHTIKSSFRELDRDGDGRVSYKDFDFMMKYDTNSHI